MLLARNPASTASIAVSVSFATLVSGVERTFMTCSTTFSVSTPNAFTFLNFTANNLAISASNVVTLKLTPRNPISPSTYLRINPSGLALSFTFNQYSNQAAIPFSSSTGGDLLLGNLTTSTTTKPSTLTLNNFTLVNPPYGNKAVTLWFSTFNLIGGVEYSIEGGTFSMTCAVSPISSAGLSAATSTINTLTTYTLWFTSINALVSTSLILYTLPTQISLASATCTCPGLPASTCIVYSNNNTLQLTTNTAVTANTNISLTISDARNPTTTTPTATAGSISTYYSDLTTLVDQLSPTNSLLKLTATAATLSAVTLTPASTQVGALSTYTLSVTLRYGLPKLSSLTVKIPTTSYSVSTLGLLSFTVSESSVSAACALTTLSDLYISLNSSCFPADLPAATVITIQLSNLYNPSSTKPTSSWQVSTYYNSYLLEYLHTGITATMASLAQLTHAQAIPTSAVVNSNTPYMISLTFSYPHYTGDRVVISLPQDTILASPTLSCEGSVPVGVIVTCQQTNSLTIVATLNLAASASSSISSLAFKLSTLTNNWYVSTAALTLQTTTNDSTLYFMETYSASVRFQPAALSATAASN